MVCPERWCVLNTPRSPATSSGIDSGELESHGNESSVGHAAMRQLTARTATCARSSSQQVRSRRRAGVELTHVCRTAKNTK
jgi:uncharacterized protein YbbK (DUF523 family)